MYEAPNVIDAGLNSGSHVVACGGSEYKIDGSEGRCYCSSEGARM